MQTVEFADAFFQHRRQADYHDQFRELRRLQADRSDLYPTLSAQRRMPEQHHRQQHYQIENVQAIAVLLEPAIIKIHKEDRKHDVDECKQPLPLDEPKTFFTRRVDVRRAAYDHQTVNYYGERRK